MHCSGGRHGLVGCYFVCTINSNDGRCCIGVRIEIDVEETVEEFYLGRGSGHHHEVVRELSEINLELLGILEVIPSQRVEVGEGLFPDHSQKGSLVVHFFLDDSEPGFGVVVVAVVVVVFVVVCVAVAILF